MLYTFSESQDAQLSNSAYGIVFGSVFMEIWTNLSTLQHHCNIFFAHCMCATAEGLSTVLTDPAEKGRVRTEGKWMKQQLRKWATTKKHKENP